MVNFSSCDKHAGCIVVFDNVDGCPVCGMIEEIVDILESKCGDSNKERLDEIREKIRNN